MDSTPVKVNVGGKTFTATLGTLQKAKYFSELALQPDLSETLIDRDPDIFAYLLNCLRDHRYIKPELLQQYQPEIEYFAMDCLKTEAEQQIPVITVAEDSLFRVECWHGIPFVQPKQDFQLTPAQIVELKMRVQLPYPGYLEVKSVDGYVDLCLKGHSKPFTVKINRSIKPVLLKAGEDLCYFIFHRDSVVKVQQ